MVRKWPEIKNFFFFQLLLDDHWQRAEDSITFDIFHYDYNAGDDIVVLNAAFNLQKILSVWKE